MREEVGEEGDKEDDGKKLSTLDPYAVRRGLHSGPKAPGRGYSFFQGPGDRGRGRDAEERREDAGFLERGDLQFFFGFFFGFCEFL